MMSPKPTAHVTLQAHDLQEAAQERESTGESPTASKRVYGSRMPDIPVCFDARLPPLHPKRCSHLTNLASAHGSLFAGETPTNKSQKILHEYISAIPQVVRKLEDLQRILILEMLSCSALQHNLFDRLV